MPSYSLNIGLVAVDRAPDSLLEVVERVAAALRPALPEGTAIEHVHLNSLDPEDADPSILIEPGDTLAVHVPGEAVAVGTVRATSPANASGPAMVTLNLLSEGRRPRTAREYVADALKDR
jgi:hypothetical protein